MDVFAKAARLGVESSFVDATGSHRSVDPSVIRIVLDAIPEMAEHRLLPHTFVMRGDGAGEAAISSAARLPIHWQIHGHSPGHAGKSPLEVPHVVADGLLTEPHLNLPRLAHGVYRLTVQDANGQCDERPLLVVPHAAFTGDFDRVWLLAVQLYGVRSQTNWGIGDFTDLESLLIWAAGAGAAGVGLNPLHALFDDHPVDCSPYSPSSRLFLNTIYTDVTRLPELPRTFAAAHADAIAACRSAELVDYVAVARLKHEALQVAFANFRAGADVARKDRFEQFRNEHGRLLRRYACFEVLRRKHAGPWWQWPEPWSEGSDQALETLHQTYAAQLEFVEYVQWCADEQLRNCRDLAERLKLSLGLYLDVAVGVKADGFDAWNEQVAISRHLSIGAPPDFLNSAGQDWGLAGFSASGLEQTSYEPFRQMLRTSMRYAGAIRLDHVLGFNRLYVIPAGYRPSEGAYVRMPLEILFGITALESAAHRCVVIGEDLGTVPDGFRDRMAEWNIWSYRVMMFERHHDGSFQRPEHYPQNALVTFSTHDLPTFAGWQSGHDIEVKSHLGINPGEDAGARAHARNLMERALRDAHLPDAGVYSALGYLAQTKCRILAVGIEDLLGAIDQANIPGTIDQHPNWRRRLPVPVEQWADHIGMDRLRTALDRSAKP